MRSIKHFNRIKYNSSWISDDYNTHCRLFNYMGLDWSLILRYKGIGGWTIRLCNDESDELYIFNSGINKMVLSLNDYIVNEIDGWYYEDINELKNKLETDLISLLKKYEDYTSN